MISYVSGTVHAVAAESVVIEVGGFGVELVASARCAGQLAAGQRATVPASLVVREERWTLYGFADPDERTCFQALQSAKGVGPRVALNLLGVLTPDALRRAVADGDARALTAAPGIGVKGAQRLVIDLRDRLGPATTGAQTAAGVAGPSAPTPPGGWRRDVELALTGLGWTAADAATALDRIAPAAEPGGPGRRPDGSTDTAVLLRLALQGLDRGTEAR